MQSIKSYIARVIIDSKVIDLKIISEGFIVSIFGNELFKEMFDVNGDGRLDATESFMRDMFVIEEVLPEDERQKINGESYFDDEI